MRWLLLPTIVLLIVPQATSAQDAGERYTGPIIDVHLHANRATDQGPPTGGWRRAGPERNDPGDPGPSSTAVGSSYEPGRYLFVSEYTGYQEALGSSP